jgi:hypothetical protein
MTTSPGLINTAARPRAERQIDGATFHVTLDLDAVADTLIDQIAALLYRQHRTWQFSLVGNPKTSPADRAAYRAQIRAALTMARAFDVPLHPGQAEELQADLFEATTEPAWCDCDTAYATRPDGLCDNCGNTADAAQANVTQIRAV